MIKFFLVTGILFFATIFMSCKGTPNNKTEVVVNGDAVDALTQEIEKAKKEVKVGPKSYTLKKVTYWRNENDPNYLIYSTKKGDNIISFYTKGDYGVLENYNEGNSDLTRYLVFSKPDILGEELTINEKDALFEVKNETLESDYSEVNLLLENYLIISMRGDPSYQESVIVNVSEKSTAGFSTNGIYKVSDDEKFLIGYEESTTNADVDKICPELEGKCCYTVVEEFKYNLATGEETKTGKLSCNFVQ